MQHLFTFQSHYSLIQTLLDEKDVIKDEKFQSHYSLIQTLVIY